MDYSRYTFFCLLVFILQFELVEGQEWSESQEIRSPVEGNYGDFGDLHRYTLLIKKDTGVYAFNRGFNGVWRQYQVLYKK